MGRTKPTYTLAPASIRKDTRAKLAKATLNKTIPDLLKAYPRARRGADSAELIVNPPKPGTLPTCPPQPQKPLIITLLTTDTITAATHLARQDPASTAAETPSSSRKPSSTQHAPKVALLNMASPLVPGGGFLNGATSQEEFLCLRTTLLPSLRDAFYRLPDVGAVYTPDVLVFRDGAGNELPKGERFWVDVVSAAMLRFPETEVVGGGEGATEAGYEDEDGDGEREGEAEDKERVKNMAYAVYAEQKDRELVVAKMRAVMRIVAAKGMEKVVLGPWGCGAYGNPVGEIARAWRKVLLEGKGRSRADRRDSNAQSGGWGSVREVVFAVKEPQMARNFANCFGDPMVFAELDMNNVPEEFGDSASSNERAELETKIDEIENQIRQARSPHLREGLQKILDTLKNQLTKTGS